MQRDTTTYVSFIENGTHVGFTSKVQWEKMKHWDDDIDLVIEFEGPSFPGEGSPVEEIDRVFAEVKQLARDAARKAGFSADF